MRTLLLTRQIRQTKRETKREAEIETSTVERQDTSLNRRHVEPLA